jgi:hypothetical protein
MEISSVGRRVGSRRDRRLAPVEGRQDIAASRNRSSQQRRAALALIRARADPRS